MNKYLFLGLLVILCIFSYTSFTLIESKPYIHSVDISDKGVVNIFSGSSNDYSGTFGMYYIEVDSKPFGYYTYYSDYDDSDRLVGYKNSIFVINDSKPHKVEVWSNTNYSFNDRDDYLDGFSACGMLSDDHYDDMNVYRTQANTLKENYLCSQVSYKTLNRYYVYENGVCNHYNIKDKKPVFSNVEPLDKCKYLTIDSYNKIIPTSQEIQQIKKRSKNYDSQYIEGVSDPESILIQFQVLIQNILTKIKEVI